MRLKKKPEWNRMKRSDQREGTVQKVQTGINGAEGNGI